MHHFATLIGYGASAINPYLLLETLETLVAEGRIVRTGADGEPVTLGAVEAAHNLVKAIGKGLLKTISKMGISTIQSYRGAQIFEAVGPREGADRHPLHGHRLAHRRRRHGRAGDRGARASRARLPGSATTSCCPSAASMRGAATASTTCGTPRRSRSCSTRCVRPTATWRRRSRATSEAHQAVRDSAAFEKYREYARAVNEHAARTATLRGLLEIGTAGTARAVRRGRCDRAAGDLDRRGRAGERDRQALLHRRDEPRLDLARGARDAGDRDEPARRALEHRRGRRGSFALRRPTPTATGGARRSSRWPRGASA